MPEEVTTQVAEGTQVETPAVEVPQESEVQVVAESPEGAIEALPPQPPKKKTYQERIDEITKARREAEREREYWKKVALEKAQFAEKPTDEPPQPPRVEQGPPRPNQDQFNTTTEYEDALFGWYEVKKSSEQTAARRQAEEDEGLRKFNRAAEKLRQEYEDFDSVIESPVFSPAMRLGILHSENGPTLAYHLGRPENRDTADRIRSLAPEAQFYELGKIEAKLLLAQSTKKVTSAPAPINPVGMTGGGTDKDPSKMSIDEWMAWDKQKTLEKLKQKYPGG